MSLFFRAAAPLVGALLCVSANIVQADPPQPQPLAPDHSSKLAASKASGTAALKLMRSPTVSETTATRQADGTISLNCAQVANPKSRLAPGNRQVNRPAPGAAQ